MHTRVVLGVGKGVLFREVSCICKSVRYEELLGHNTTILKGVYIILT